MVNHHYLFLFGFVTSTTGPILRNFSGSSPPLRSRAPWIQLGVWGSAVSSPSGVWGETPADDFGAIWAPRKAVSSIVNKQTSWRQHYLLINLCLKINATRNLGCTLFNSECTISAGNTLRIGTARPSGCQQNRTNHVPGPLTRWVVGTWF